VPEPPPTGSEQSASPDRSKPLVFDGVRSTRWLEAASPGTKPQDCGLTRCTVNQSQQGEARPRQTHPAGEAFSIHLKAAGGTSEREDKEMAKSKSTVRVSRQSRNAATQTRAGATKPTRAKKRASSRANETKTRRSATKVMGVAIPKSLTSALDSLVNSPRGREILASALVAAASAAAAALVKSPDSPQPAKARLAAADVADQVAEATKDLSEVAAGALADMVTGAARSLLPASITGNAQRKD
jgi:hypothetical protein